MEEFSPHPHDTCKELHLLSLAYRDFFKGYNAQLEFLSATWDCSWKAPASLRRLYFLWLKSRSSLACPSPIASFHRHKPTLRIPTYLQNEMKNVFIHRRRWPEGSYDVAWRLTKKGSGEYTGKWIYWHERIFGVSDSSGRKCRSIINPVSLGRNSVWYTRFSFKM